MDTRENRQLDLPQWAQDWVPLRMMGGGLRRSNANLYVPRNVGDVVNDARRQIEGSDSVDAELHRTALMPPPEPVATADDASTPAPNPTVKPSRKRRPRLPGVAVRVIEQAALDAYVASAPILGLRKSKDDARADKERAELIAQRGGFRTAVLDRHWRQALDRLRDEMPNFDRVIRHVLTYCELAVFTGAPLRIPPILLVGLPGLGKSRFATQLAKAIGVPHFVYSLEDTETSSGLTGSDKHWANSEPGQLFRLIVLGDVANPLIVLDEIDKAIDGATPGRAASSQYRPAAALHRVLEAQTSRALRDKSADMAFDCSHAIYIATTNRLSSVAPSLLSRFKIFHIAAPDARAAVEIARSVSQAVFAQWGLAGKFRPVAGEVLQQLAVLGSPRLQRQVLQTAIVGAIGERRTALCVRDLDRAEVNAYGNRDNSVMTH